MAEYTKEDGTVDPQSNTIRLGAGYCSLRGALIFLAASLLCTFAVVLALAVADWPRLKYYLFRSKGLFKAGRSLIACLPPAVLFGALDGLLGYQQFAGTKAVWRARRIELYFFSWYVALVILSVARPVVFVFLLAWLLPFLLYMWKRREVMMREQSPPLWFYGSGFLFCLVCFTVFVLDHGIGHLHDSLPACIYGSFWLGDSLVVGLLYRKRERDALEPSSAEVLQFSLSAFAVVVIGCGAYYLLMLELFPRAVGW